MPRRPILHELAITEISDAVEYGEERWPENVMALISQIESTVSAIAENPFHYHPRKYGVRRVNLKRFPYHIIYLPLDDTVWIVSLSHDQSLPEHWKTRLEDKPKPRPQSPRDT